MDGDKELVAFIWRLLGYGLIRERKDHIFMIFHGEHGRNGKDTLIKLITDARQGAFSDVPVEMLLQTPNVKNSSGLSARCDEAARHVHRVDQRGREENCNLRWPSSRNCRAAAT